MPRVCPTAAGIGVVHCQVDSIQWRWWIVLVSRGTGTLLAVLGVLAASRQAAAVRPLEALRDSGQAMRVRAVSRRPVGLVVTIAGVFPRLFFPGGDAAPPPHFVQVTPLLVTASLMIGPTAWAPIIAPLAADLFSRVFRRPLGATPRVAGLIRTQVVGTALLESRTVVAIGLILGGVAASSGILGAALEDDGIQPRDQTRLPTIRSQQP